MFPPAIAEKMLVDKFTTIVSIESQNSSGQD
jgi:hypothetical protein